VELLRKQNHITKDQYKDYDQFLGELKDVIDIDERYQIPKYKFLGLVDISPAIKNTIISVMTTSFLSVAFDQITSI
jgi:hypothetical protein